MLIRDQSMFNESQQQRLDNLLAQNQNLNQVYDFKRKLQAIWDQTTASQKELLEALQEWCKQAEASGIRALHDFVATMRGYTLQAQPAQ